MHNYSPFEGFILLHVPVFQTPSLFQFLLFSFFSFFFLYKPDKGVCLSYKQPAQRSEFLLRLPLELKTPCSVDEGEKEYWDMSFIYSKLCQRSATLLSLAQGSGAKVWCQHMKLGCICCICFFMCLLLTCLPVLLFSVGSSQKLREDACTSWGGCRAGRGVGKLLQLYLLIHGAIRKIRQEEMYMHKYTKWKPHTKLISFIPLCCAGAGTWFFSCGTIHHQAVQ